MSPRFRDPARLAGSRLLRLQSDERLVALSRDGHEAAFAAIVDRYRPALERYTERLVGRSRAEDAVQQAFVNAHRAMMRDDREIQLKAWLYRITHNAALNILRTVHDDVELDDATFGPPATAMAASGAIEDVVELHTRLRETLDAISLLPTPQRDALLLRELEGRSHDEIALALGITSGAARQHVMRARTALRAAATAVTPYPLISHFAAPLSQNPSVAATGAELLGGAGASAVAFKLTAGFAATGALVSAFAVPAIRSDDPPLRTPPAAAARHDPAGPADAPTPSIHRTRAALVAPGDNRVENTRRTSGSGRRDGDEDRRNRGDGAGEGRRAPVREDSDHADDRGDREDGRSGSGGDRATDHASGTDDDSPEHTSSSESGDSDDLAGSDTSGSGSGSSSGSGSGDAVEPSDDGHDIPETDEADLDVESETRSAETMTTETRDDD